MLRYLAFAALLTAASLASCKKEGINEDLDPTTQQTFDFMSTKAGSEWQFASRDGITYTRYARGRDTVRNGLTYAYFERLQHPAPTPLKYQPEYFGKNNGRYITLLDVYGDGNTILEYVYWLDSAKNGDKWTNTGNIDVPTLGNTSVLTESEQVESGLTLSWNGQTFKDVIHVQSELKGSAFNIYVGQVDMWFTREVGIIRQQADINILNGFYTRFFCDSLVGYTIVR